ncbi:hypothetical protein, partial [Sunxiuqinia elliptica]|uniref:hypothetical protein n=1 Tax=Sunxiuqinia elliptica TaxID=655355 RepID=UPI001AACB639
QLRQKIDLGERKYCQLNRKIVPMEESIKLVEGPSWIGDSKIKGFKISIVPRWRKSVICALSPSSQITS